MGNRRLTLVLSLVLCLFTVYITFKVASAKPEQSAPALPEAGVSGNIMCGPAALQTVCRSLGLDIPVEAIARLAGTDSSGTTMYGLAQAARQMGFNAVGMNLSRNELTNYRKPLIAYLKPNHFIAVGSINDQKVTYSDQSGSNLEMGLGDFSQRWAGQVLIVTK